MEIFGSAREQTTSPLVHGDTKAVKRELTHPRSPRKVTAELGLEEFSADHSSSDMSDSHLYSCPEMISHTVTNL